MLEKLVAKLKSLKVEAVPFDPSGLGDDLALQVDWSPAKGGGANFGTHRLVDVDMSRKEFRVTRGMIAFCLAFLLIGLGVMVAFGVATLTGNFDLGDQSPLFLLIPFGSGGLFAAIGGAMLYFTAAPIVFDKRRGGYWKGRTAPFEMANRREHTNAAQLDRVYALQLVKEHCSGNDTSYYSYELNLVLDDGTRLNVIDHGDLERLREDARRLGEFLERPVWDAT